MRRRLLALLLLALCVVAVVVPALGAVVWPRWAETRDRAVAMADAHARYEVAHPGWSFPARLWSAPAPLDLPPARLALEAQARGYAPACPPVAPGDYCAKTGEVIPRGGRFPEGPQPAGTEGWTRPLALEPALMGWLVGPDAEIREHLPLAEAPEHLIAAILAAEDEAFWDHSGVNFRGVARATWMNARGEGVQQGASTLTMQVVRNLSQDKERSFERKLREMASAIAIDRHLGKEGVLQLYLDAPYLGQSGSFSICGFQAAAHHYWGVDAADLTLAQAATLAAILPAPGRFAPDRAPDEAQSRRDRLLRHMAELGWDPAQVEAALAEPLGASPHELPASRFPAYVHATRQWLDANVPPETLYGAGLDVFTGASVVAQAATEEVMPQRIRFLEGAVGRRGEGPLEAAGAAVDLQTGLLVAVYGGTLASATDFSRATQAKRQGGSAIKPLVYALAFDQVDAEGKHLFSHASAMPNEPRRFPGAGDWVPHNVHGEYTKTASLAYALPRSENVAAVSLLDAAGGPTKLIALANKLGFDTRTWKPEYGLALGQGEVTPLEMARFVASIATEGLLPSARPVHSATDPTGRVRITPPPPPERVFTPEGAALTRELMRSVVLSGTGGSLRGIGGLPGYDGPAIGKTGTSDEEKDVWFIGSTGRIASAVWVGYDWPVRVGGGGSEVSAPLWGWWNRALHEGLPRDDFGGMKLQLGGICKDTGLRPNATCVVVAGYFLPGTIPGHTCGEEHPPYVKPEYESIWEKRAKAEEELRAAKEAEAAGLLPDGDVPLVPPVVGP